MLNCWYISNIYRNVTNKTNHIPIKLLTPNYFLKDPLLQKVHLVAVVGVQPTWEKLKLVVKLQGRIILYIIKLKKFLTPITEVFWSWPKRYVSVNTYTSKFDWYYMQLLKAFSRKTRAPPPKRNSLRSRTGSTFSSTSHSKGQNLIINWRFLKITVCEL